MKKIIAAVFTLIISTALTSNPVAQPNKNPKKLLATFSQKILETKYQDTKDVSAISLVSQCKSGPPIQVYAGNYTLQDKNPIDKNALFQTGSITKSFVSVVILQLAEKYHLNLDSDQVIAKYFPEYPRWGKVTLRQLMNMTSGIPGNGNKDNDDIYRHFTGRAYTSYISPTKILDLTYQYPLHFKPGTHYEYSNTNYVLLGQLIQKITGHSGISEIQKRIFDKLGLEHTYFPTDKLTDIAGVNPSEIVHGYAFYSKTSDPYPFIKFGEDTINFSHSEDNYAGAIVSTPTDINQYVHALYQPGVLLNKSQLKQFTSLISLKNGQAFLAKSNPNQIGYGLGIFGFYSSKTKSMIYFYQGQTDGFQFIYMYDPKTRQYLSFSVNTAAPIVTQENSSELFNQLNEICKKV